MPLSDIFREVEEEVRRERFEQIWKQYGDYIIAGIALIVIAVAGFELWQRYEANQKLKASETFIAAQQLAIGGNFNQASAAFAVVAKDAPDGYAKMARLSQAGVLEVSGQRNEALMVFKSIAKDDDGLIGDVARLRAGWILAVDGPRADMDSLLAPLTDPTSPWRFSARDHRLCGLPRRSQRQGTKGISGCRERQRREPDASATLRRYGHVPEEWRNEQLWQGSAASGTGACGYQSCAQCCQPTGPCTMKMRTVAVLAFLVGVASFTAGCTVIDTVGDWFDAGPKKSKLRGERISVMSADASLHLDQSLKGVDVVLPPPYANSEWPEPGGYASNAMYHLEAKGPLRKLWEQDAGKGSDTASRLTAAPVVADGKIYVLDSEA